jgi:glycosyltransferase involved in cell wall biosynthesis
MNDFAMLYIGAFAPDKPEFQNAATSRAAVLFQSNFLDALVASGFPRPEVRSYIPVPSFPRSRTLLAVPRCVPLDNGLTLRSLAHLNVGALKILTLGISSAWAVLRWGLRNRGRKRIVMTYNLNAPPAFFVAPVCRLLGIDFVPFVGDIYVPGEVVSNSWLRQMEFHMQKRAVAMADGLVVCNKAIAEDFAPGRGHVLIEGGVPESFARSFRASSEGGGFHIVFAGQLTDLNGVQLLLDAIEMVDDPDLRVTVLGAGPMAPDVRRDALTDQRIDFRGLVPHQEVLDVYKSADLLLNLRSTEYETHKYVFPSKVVECLATGVPLLSTRTGHIEEEFGDFVFLLDDETPKALVRAIEFISRLDPGARANFGRAAQQYVLRHKTWEAHVSKLSEYLEREVLSKRVAREHAKMRVLAFVDYYLPGNKGGGPAHSVSRMAEGLDRDTELLVFTRDRDLGDRAAYADVTSDRWNARPEATVYYASPRRTGLVSIYKTIRASRPNVIYLNSFFSDMTRTVLLLRAIGFLKGVGVVIAPRGELSPGAMGIKSFKKRAYVALTRLARYYRGVLWKPSTGLELRDIEAAIGKVTNIVLAEKPAAPSLAQLPTKIAGQCRFVFLSRVSRIKNIEFAVDCLSKAEGRIELDVVGPLEDDKYAEELRAQIALLPPNVTVRLLGPVPHEDVKDALAQAHVFLLPTKGENFGHAIAEALAIGQPCLISDRTPWSDLQGAGAGWAVPLEDPDQWAARIWELVQMGEPEFRALAARVPAYYSAKTAEMGTGQAQAVFEQAAKAA